MNLSGKIGVIGLGMEGKDLVKFLVKRGAEVWVLDKKREEELDFSGIDRKKIRLVSGENYLDGLGDFKVVFRSPGVYRYLPELVRAQKQGVEISSAIKLFFELCPGRIIGVTGTKGKGTTSTLIYKILKKQGKDVYLAGNIGKAYLELLAKIKKESWVVMELSSFQLIDLDKSPKIAVVLMIGVDHLDWHKNKKEYVEAKKNIVRYQKKGSWAVINGDNEVSKSFVKLGRSKKYYFSRKREVKGCWVDGGKIWLKTNGKKEMIGEVKSLKLRGKHNWENVGAAVCTARLAGASLKAIREMVFSFEGLEHRLERVKKVKGVVFYNDSFSTNPETAMAAIGSFEEPITLILGGYDKSLSYKKLARRMVKKGNVVNAILIGDIRNKLKKELKGAGFKGKCINMRYGEMERIVKKSLEVTPKGGVVLLSPASASFDMFENYKERGNSFKKAVNGII